MRALCFGGSFNPIHHGHLVCARAAAEAGRFDRVLLIPSGQPPHKRAVPTLAPAHHRLAMCRLAARSAPEFFEVSDIELVLPGPSYTLRTVRRLKEAGMRRVDWLIGADMLADLPNWYEPHALMAEARLHVMARPGWRFDWASLPPAFRVLRQRVLEAPLIDISATQIRRRVARGQAIEYLTPPAVVEYIRRHALYRGQRVRATDK